jgi:formylglycine-generating enzyme required for sulfatase activity
MQPERRMMRRATRYHALRACVAAACLILLCLLGRESYGRLMAHTLRDRLLEASTKELPGIVKDLPPFRRWLDPLLDEAYRQAERVHDPRKQLHASVALLPAHSGHIEYLYDRLLAEQSQEVVVIRAALSDHKLVLAPRLWALLEDPKKDQDQRFRAACALAAFAPDDPRWQKASADAAATLVIQKPFVIAQWTDAFKDVGHWLIPPLADFLADERRSVSERGLIATIYATYAPALPDAYARLENRLDEKSDPHASVDARIALAKRQASIALALLVMGRGEKAWPLFEHRPDPTLRSYLIDRAGLSGVDAKMLWSRLDDEKQFSARQAILMSLGGFGLDRLGLAERTKFLPRLLQSYRDETDPGIHAAVLWLLEQWQADGNLEALDNALATGQVQGNRRWYINRHRQTMMVVAGAGEFWMGEGEERHRQQISRHFAIASKPVSVSQFLEFRKEHEYSKKYAPSRDCPVNMVTWYEAAAYCNWLSEQEGIPNEEWCYLANAAGKYEAGMKITANHLQRTGYRLPTEAEWEYACRAGAITAWSFGESDELLGKYGWYMLNAASMSHPGGKLLPNDLGLFDMHGNNFEWCQDAYNALGNGRDQTAAEDKKDQDDIRDDNRRVLRAGSFSNPAMIERSAFRASSEPASRITDYGLRPARTLPP